MDLVKEHWREQDIAEFEEYLLSLGRDKAKGEWEQRIINTQLPCIAVPSPAVNQIVKAISKCHDSFRVAAADKEMLKHFRQSE